MSTEIRRKLSLHQARNRLTWTWLAFSGPLLLIVILQSINGKYGQSGFETLTGIGWLFQAVLPTASVMIAPITLPINPAVETRSVENLTLLWITICSFIFYFVILYAIILLEPMTGLSLENLMAMSAWFLAPIQAFILTLVSKFFLESL